MRVSPNWVRGLLRTGAIKEIDRPLWYDVYEAFPPKIEPRHERFKEDCQVTSILYKEDLIRAKFYSAFGSPDTIDLRDSSTKPLSQRFIEMYQEMEKSGMKEGEIFKTVTDSLRSEGIQLKTLEEIQTDTKLRALKIMQENAAKKKEILPTSEDLFGSSISKSSVDEPDSAMEDDYRPTRL